MMEAEDDIVFEEPPLEVLKQSSESNRLSDDGVIQQAEQALLEADRHMSLLSVKPTSHDDLEQSHRRRLDTASTEGDATSSDGEESTGHDSKEAEESASVFPFWIRQSLLFGGIKGPTTSSNSLNSSNANSVDGLHQPERREVEKVEEDEKEQESDVRSITSDISDIPELLLPVRGFTIEEEQSNNAFLSWMSQNLQRLHQEEHEKSKDDDDNEETSKTEKESEEEAGGGWKWWMAKRAKQEQQSQDTTPKDAQAEEGEETGGLPWIAQRLQNQLSSDSGDVTFLRLLVEDNNYMNKEEDDDDSVGSEEVDFLSQDTVVYRESCFLDEGYKAWDGAGEFCKD